MFAYMLATNVPLREAMGRLVHNKGIWNQEHSAQLYATLRFYLNDVLAQREGVTYAPASARAKLMRNRNGPL